MINLVTRLRQLLEDDFEESCENYLYYDGDDEEVRDVLREDIDTNNTKLNFFDDIVETYDLPQTNEICDCCGDGIEEDIVEAKMDRILSAVPSGVPGEEEGKEEDEK